MQMVLTAVTALDSSFCDNGQSSLSTTLDMKGSVYMLKDCITIDILCQLYEALLSCTRINKEDSRCPTYE